MSDAFILEPVADRAALRHPCLRLLFDAWLAATLPGQNLPCIDDLLPPAQAVAADHLWWLERVPGGGPSDFIGRGFGRQTVANYGIDPTGRHINEYTRQPVFGRILRVLTSVTAAQQPHRFTADQSVMSNGALHDVEALALPVAGPDGAFWGVLGATRAREI
ncbi:MAG: hypothetical protein JHC88_06300 [Niveispirillum sp.]|nr:hypothetical protein [Niveispirillum sp.]